MSPSYSTQQCNVRLNEFNNLAQQVPLVIWSSGITEYGSIGDASQG